MGAADVVPLRPLRPEQEPEARSAALELADRIGDELELPVFFYGRLTDEALEPAFFRGRDGRAAARIDAGELLPDRGPNRLHGTAGAVLLGVRRPLIAFNVNLRARASRSPVRSQAWSGNATAAPGVRALGLDLPSAGIVQVSMNVTDWEAAALHGSSSAWRPRRKRAARRSSAASSSASCLPGRRRCGGRRSPGSTASTQPGARAPPARERPRSRTASRRSTSRPRETIRLPSSTWTP